MARWQNGGCNASLMGQKAMVQKLSDTVVLLLFYYMSLQRLNDNNHPINERHERR
jgi:hypothetical protein